MVYARTFGIVIKAKSNKLLFFYTIAIVSNITEFSTLHLLFARK